MQMRRSFPRITGPAALVVVLALLLAGCGSNTPSAPTGDPIKLGGLWLLSGAFSAYGEFAREGAQMAVDEINSEGGVLGRPLEITFQHEGSAQEVVQNARRLVFEEKVDFLIGLDSSGTAQALAPSVPELGKLLMVTHAASGELTGKLCNPYVFRASVNVPQNSYMAAKIAAEQYPNVTSWGTIGPDYAFGYETWEAFTKSLKARNSNATFAKPVYAPLANEDYSSHISRVLDAKFDGLFVSLWGADLVNFIRQAKDFGLFDKVTPVFQLGAAMEVLEALGTEMPTGFWAGTRYWWDGVDSDVNRDFVENFRDRYDHVPSYNAEAAYTGVRFLALATEKADSTEADAVIKALEGLAYDAPQGRTVIRAEDHQALVEPTWGKLTESSDQQFRILDPVLHASAEEATPAVKDTGCTMG